MNQPRRVVAASLLTLAVFSPALRADDHHDAHLLPGVESSDVPTPSFPTETAPLSLVVPTYHSLPSAAARIYLDFDGDVTASWGSYSPGTTPAYSTDSDTANFTASELSNIHEIWSRVSEFYSPFNIDVTTEDPGTLNDLQSLRVVIGGDGMRSNGTYWPGARAGGIGYIGGFYNFNSNTVYVFPGNLGNGTPKYVAEASAHEGGHGFGLQHQSLYDSNGNKLLEYSTGVPGVKAPFMGRPYEAIRGLWWNGTSLSSNFFQDDLSILSSALNQFGYRSDDYGNSIGTAGALDVSSGGFAASGVITSITDVDFLTFSLPSETNWLALTVSGAPFGGMLDASLSLYDSGGQLIVSSATASLSESLALELAAGQYSIAISSAGNYGDIGQFFLSGTVGVPEPALAGVVLGIATLRRRCRTRVA